MAIVTRRGIAVSIYYENLIELTSTADGAS